jgi:hypothetical protein
LTAHKVAEALSQHQQAQDFGASILGISLQMVTMVAVVLAML